LFFFTNHRDAERHKAMISVNQWPSYLKLAWTKSTIAHCVWMGKKGWCVVIESLAVRGV